MIIVGLAALLAAAPATAAERGYAVAGFDRVRSAGPFDVEIHTGAPVSVRAVGPQRAIDKLDIRSEGGALVIRVVDGNWDWRSLFSPNERLVVRVSLPTLTGVTLTGSGDVTVDRARAPAFTASLAGSGDLSVGALEAQTATLRVSGSGDLTVAGRARTASAGVAGSGDIVAAGLTVTDADVRVVGSGNVALAASGTANVSLVGSGDVRITGRPRCTVNRRGSGEVRCGG
jgi:hypothetical protein